MSALNKVLALAQGSAPDFRDVNFPVYPDTSQQLDLHQPQDSSFHFSDRASQELSSLPDVYREQVGRHLDDASDLLADGDLRGAATCLVQAVAVAHLQGCHRLAQEIHVYARAVALGGNDTPEPDDAKKLESDGKAVGYQNDNPSSDTTGNSVIRASRGALDKVLALAGALPQGIHPAASGMSHAEMTNHLLTEHHASPPGPAADVHAAHMRLHALGSAGHEHAPEPRVRLTAGRRAV